MDVTDSHTDFLGGKTAIITGASRGIGAATARLFAEAGASVVLTARSAGEIGALASDLTGAGHKARAVTCDIAERASVERMIAETESAFGPVDILVNNAGTIDPIGPIAETDPDAWAACIDVNVKGVYWTTRAVLPGMIARGTGTIVNIGSGASVRPLEGWSHYCTSKAAAHMLTRATHLEAHGAGVRVVGLSPGTVATDMQRAIKSSGINPVSKLDWSDHIPPEWPAKAIAWLCGPDGAGFAGEELKLRDDDIRRRIGLID